MGCMSYLYFFVVVVCGLVIWCCIDGFVDFFD